MKYLNENCFLVALIIILFFSQSGLAQKTNTPLFLPVAAPSFVEVKDVRGYNALVLVPSNTSQVINGKYPAILFLHGISERGNNLNLLKLNGFPRNLEGDEQFPFIFIMPQCPITTEWYYTNADNVTAMKNFLDDILAKFPVDSSRLYITGLSMGGIGSWYFAINLPSRFAALVPVAFRGDGWSPAPAKDIPVWAFHGAKDNVIPLSKAQELVDQFKSDGGSVRFQIYPDGWHDNSTWGVTYNNPDVYDWMLRKKKVIVSAPKNNADENVPNKFLLEQNFPNPFNPTTIIRYGIFGNKNGDKVSVTLKVYDFLGREIQTLVNANQTAGTYEITFDASKITAGIYFYRLQAGTLVSVKKMMLIK
ncbi:MAG: T9SS type A sorting domain-containing protein [Bacteroidetes bacterium]|nr:T9SS type A sorting domain-containing protein [Bacteroidota bacterium]